MTDQDWAECISNHRIRFVMNGPSADALFALMRPVFEDFDCRPEEFETASQWMWLDLDRSKEIFWSEHCRILRNRIFKMRADAAKELVAWRSAQAFNGPKDTRSIAEVRAALAAKLAMPEEKKA